MKKRLLPVAFVFWATYASGQVGVGTLNPDNSAQLDVQSMNKGVLIPRVALTDVTDATTIVNGNVNSLLVFNTNTQNNIIPGYYYWYENKWMRIVNEADVVALDTNTKNQSLAINNGMLILTDTDGDTVSVPLKDLNLPETVTTIVNNGTSFTYTNEANQSVTVDLLAGPKGDTGAVGPQGPQGIAGADGAKGDKGDSGAVGPQGPQGIAGADGAKGDKGDTGAVGPQGPQGVAGIDGAKGDKGDTGAVGPQGPQGIAGADGAKGDTGAVGPQGPQGIAGQNGTNGVDGQGGVTTVTSPGLSLTGTGTQADPYVITNTSLNTDNQQITDLSLAAGTLSLTLENGGTKTVDLSGINTDDQQITDFSLAGTVLTVTLEDGGTKTVDLVGLVATADNGLTKTANNIQLGGSLIKPTTITADAANTLAVAGLQAGAATDKLVVADPITGVLKSVDQTVLAIEPWNVRATTNKAKLNTENIYQMGNVAIGTQRGIGTFHIDAAKNNPTTTTPSATQVLDDVIFTPGGRIGFGYNPSDIVFGGRQFDDKVTYQANDDLDFNYSLATTNNYQAIVHRNIISGGQVGARTARGRGQSIVAFEGHTSTSDGSFATSYLATQQRADIVLRTGKDTDFGGEIWFGTASSPTAVQASSPSIHRAIMDEHGNWAYGADPTWATYRTPSERLDIIFGSMRIGALGYNSLAPWRTDEIAERAKYQSTNTNDQLVVADGDGVLKVKPVSAILPAAVTSDNGLTKTANNIQLGGALIQPTTVIADATNTLAVTGLQNSTVVTDKVMMVDAATGVLKTKNIEDLIAGPKYFYAPSIVLPTNASNLPVYVTENAGTFTVNLHTDVYAVQFGMSNTATSVKSPSATTLPVIDADKLEYFITYFDNSVFTNVTVSDTGLMTYEVITGATVSEKTYMNIVFKVK